MTDIKLLDLIYPRRCPICREIVIPKDRLACVGCEGKLTRVKEPRCMKCGRQLMSMEKEYCSNCMHNRFHFEEGMSLWIYDDIMKQSIGDYKFRNHRENADYYIQCLAENCAGRIERWRPDALVPVPLHKSKKRYRGYNQSEIIATGLGNIFRIPVYTNLLIRDRMTLPQKNLNSRERLQNLEHAFEFNNKALDSYELPKSIVLIDDIYTTGSTIEACTRICLKNGVESVFFICLCTGISYIL